MAHYRASESKREQFRRYLEKSGVLDTITSVLVALYEDTDKPDNALEYPYYSGIKRVFYPTFGVSLPVAAFPQFLPSVVKHHHH
ncbi:c-Myc-binding protein-like isoform X2 [Plectropomus leopardus]|uniref:c-Myc-binding protein-like isoform X2 n=1 Tax=Plectropomus leopardus TaxID=160734 RepID=UPI001C4CB0F2|nr:c-Myc-binding protein-like isoform X2 [Plectropomus leopardus]